jgi:pilus assembly protein CpaB
VSIAVAGAAIPRGALVSADSVKMREYPKDLVPAGAITRLEDAVERWVNIPLAKDDPLVEVKLLAKGAGGITRLIPKGMRAFTIHTPGVESGVAGFILPGSRVDVLLTVSNPGTIDDATGGGSTTTLLQNVEILAVDQRLEAPSENKVDPKELRSVTLLVTPNQAAKLDLGQNKGTLHLSLRHPEDNAPAVTTPATLAELRFHQEKPWDERAKGVLAAFVDSVVQLKKQQDAKQSASAPPSEVAPVAHIRTLRGAQEGLVVLQASSSGR